MIANEITEFTISPTFLSLIEILAALEKHGISMADSPKGKDTLQRLEDRQIRHYPCNQNDSKKGKN